MRYVAMSLCGLIICIAIIIIINIRSKKKVSKSVIENARNVDIIDEITSHNKTRLRRNPWNMSYRTYMLIGVAASVIFTIGIYVMTLNLLYAAIGFVVGWLMPELIVAFQNSKQRTAFEERYARGLRQLSSNLKSGLTIQQAVESICESPFVHDTIRTEFRQLDADLKIGISIQEGFERFAERVHCQDAKDVAIAITMQNQIGGQEAKVVETIARNIGSRLMLRKEINSMFAGSKSTVFIMDILPFGIIAFLYGSSPEYFDPFFESVDMTFIFFGILLFMGVGSIVIHRMVAKMRKECGI